MQKLASIERNWRLLLESLDTVGENLRQGFNNYARVLRRCDNYFMQKHGRKTESLQDVVAILNSRSVQRAQVFLDDSDFNSLLALLNQFYRLRDVHNSAISDVLKPLYRYHYLYFSQDRRRERQLENAINAANTARIFITAVEREGDKRGAPKPFGKEEVKPHQKIWHVLSFLENSLLGLRPVFAELEEWRTTQQVGPDVDLLQPLLSFRYSRDPPQQLQQPVTSRRRRQQQQQQQDGMQLRLDDEDGDGKWENQLRLQGERLKPAPSFPRHYGGMVNNYVSVREDLQLQQEMDQYWRQEAALQEQRKKPLIPQRRRRQQPMAIAGSRFEDMVQHRAESQQHSLATGMAASAHEGVFITEAAGSDVDTPRFNAAPITSAAAAAAVAAAAAAAAADSSNSSPPAAVALPAISSSTEPVRAVRGFDPDTYLQELRDTQLKLQVVQAALKQQETEAADLKAKMQVPDRRRVDESGRGDSFDWLKVLQQEKEANIHNLRQRVDLLNFQKRLILSRLQAPLFTY